MDDLQITPWLDDSPRTAVVSLSMPSHTADLLLYGDIYTVW